MKRLIAVALRLDPCPLVGQVSEIRGLELSHQLELDPCHLVWRVNEIIEATE
jgi:hypothetical protein